MRKILLPILGALAVGALILAQQEATGKGGQDADAESAVGARSRLERLPDGRTAIRLDAETQRLIQLKTAPAAASTIARERTAYGRVLDPAPLESLAAALASARAALDASSREYQRVKSLHSENDNASAHALEIAEAAMKHDRVEVEAARLRLATDWGQAVAGQGDLPAFVGSLATLQAVLVRLDLPSGDALIESPTGAQLTAPGIAHRTQLRLLDRAPTTDPRVQGTGFLFVATNPPPELTPGLAVTGFLQLPGKPLSGAMVPDAAVVRSAGHTWVYVQVSETSFARQEIAPNHPVPGGWFVTKGVSPKDRVVVTGAETLLSEELRTRIKLPD